MIHRSYRKLTLLALIFAIGFSPALTFAKGNNGNGGKGKDHAKVEFSIEKLEKKEKKEIEVKVKAESKDNDNQEQDKHEEKRLTHKAWGHLIAPGFIKNWGWMDGEGFHNFPFGIWKKFFGNGTTTPSTDTTAPIITDVDADSNRTSAEITWDTNERADSTVFWSTSSPIDLNDDDTSSISKSSLTRDHEIELNDLTASTTYFAIVRSKDEAGNVSTSTQFSFSTTGATTTDTQSPIISNVVALAGTSTIAVSWSTNEVSNSKMFYSTTSPLVLGATTTNSIAQSSLIYNHNVQATNLATGTPYYIIIQSTDAVGNVSTTPEFTATTTPGI